MKKLKKITLLILSAFVLLAAALVWHRVTNREIRNYGDIRAKAAQAKAYCKANGYNTDYCILVDFGIHSGRKRFYVWDFKAETVVISSLCCHGSGRKSTASAPEFSNVDGSHCSSLGLYQIGKRAQSKFGINIHYKMHGLEQTNDNAYSRTVVLHSYKPVPEIEIYPLHLPLGMSKGCPVISNDAMRQVDALLKKTETPVLMWIYS